MPVETPHDEGPPAGFRAESRSVYGDFLCDYVFGEGRPGSEGSRHASRASRNQLRNSYRRQIACEVKLAMRAGPSGREAREARAVTGHLRFYTNFTYFTYLHAIFMFYMPIWHVK